MSQQAKYNRLTGFTLVELLISLVIVGMLLAAVAVALSASAVNYRENEQVYRAINSARQALERMTSELRTAGTYIGSTFVASKDPYASNNKCDLFTAAGQDITYEYRAADNKLYLITNSNSNEYVLCDNVTNAVFIKTMTDDGSDVKSVRISLTVQCGDHKSTLSAAAVIRKNL
jgi:prepilin-type N-terminal cleavage/methylation domain-containing protein